MADALLEANGLTRHYPPRRGSRDLVRAVDGVSLQVARGQSLGVVGESGSGKSTLVRLLLALERPDRGTVRFDGHPISELPDSRTRPLRRRFQAVFQDPIGSLNPRLRVATIVGEPLVAHRLGGPTERQLRVAELLDLVGLPADAARRYPGAFSGGERQRIAIARALGPEPELLVLDEPVSSLDVSVQARILALLADLRHRLDLTMVLVAHDLAVVRELCDVLVVMHRGRVVEEGATQTILERPAHPTTRDLLAAAPMADPKWRPPVLDSPSRGIWPDKACRYADRCSLADAICRNEPALEEVADGHRAACWHSDRVHQEDDG